MSFRQNAKSEEDLLLFAFLILPAGLCSRSLLLIYNTLQTLYYKIHILGSAHYDKNATVFYMLTQKISISHLLTKKRLYFIPADKKEAVFHTCRQRRGCISHLPTKKRLYFTLADKEETVFHTCW